MGLLDSLLGSLTGNSHPAGKESQLVEILSALVAQNGGIQGLMSKFSQRGLGDAFSSWVGTGKNEGISPAQIQSALGHDQVGGLASRLGTNSEEVSGFLATYLPQIIDKLTPSGQVPAGEESSQGLAALLPTLLKSLGNQGGGVQNS